MNAAWDDPEDVRRWLTNRGCGIGSSDASAVVGCNPYKTSLEVYMHKIDNAPATGNLPNEPAMRAGLILEPAVARYYELEFGCTLVKPEPRIHPKYSWMGATADRAIVVDGRIVKLVELKTASSFAKGWGESGGDASDIPEMYHIQCQHQMAVFNVDMTDVAVLIDGRDFRWYMVQRNEAIIESIIEIEQAFWDCVQRREPPEPEWAHEATLDLVGRLNTPKPGTYIALPEELRTDLELRAEAAEQIKGHEKEIKLLKDVKDAAQARIIHAMGTAETATLGAYKVKRGVVKNPGYTVAPFDYPSFRVTNKG